MGTLDIGCGNNKHSNAVGLDKFPHNDVDVVWDLEKTPLPFGDEQFDKVIAFHILEHITNLKPLMEDILRILKSNGILHIKVPFFASELAFTNPFHKRFFTYSTFECFTNKNMTELESMSGFKIIERKLRFLTKKKYLKLIEKIINKHANLYQRFFSRILPCDELEIKLVKI